MDRFADDLEFRISDRFIHRLDLTRDFVVKVTEGDRRPIARSTPQFSP
jgi:hypothetical protein